jgi:hypothetical protein
MDRTRRGLPLSGHRLQPVVLRHETFEHVYPGDGRNGLCGHAGIAEAVDHLTQLTLAVRLARAQRVTLSLAQTWTGVWSGKIDFNERSQVRGFGT